MRAIALVLAVVLPISVAQVVISSSTAAVAAIPRDLPLLSVPSTAKQHQAPEPERPKADFAPLAGGAHAKAGGRRPARDAAPAPQTSLVAPVDQAVVGTETPVLQVASAGDGVLYCFKISTGFDGRSGSVVDSGCLEQPQWTVPKHVLHDGGRYTWTAATAMTGATTATAPNWVGHFTVNQRVGDPGPAPTDQLGPVTVNLFNGNAHVESAGPAFQAVGGAAGVTLAYNSRAGAPHGVRAQYFNDSRHTGTPDDIPVLTRSESQVNLDYGIAWSGNPDNQPWRDNPMPPALDKNWFVVRWEGHFQAPVTGDFRFAGGHADGAKVWVGGKLVYDNPTAADPGDDFATAGPKRDGDVPLKAGQRVPVKIELYHHTDQRPRMVLWAKSTTGADDARSNNLAPTIVPTEWLFAADPPALPGGWTLSARSSGYSQAEMLDGSVVLTDGAGGKHTWAKQSAGGYSPPVGEDGVLAVDNAGRITVTEGDVVSVFNPDGTLSAVASVLDSKKPAALQYLYSGTPARLVKIQDPVSRRAHELFYNTDGSDNCYGGTTRPPGADAAPPQTLCRIRYWDGTETRLWYLMGTLARIENPGAAIQDFDYKDRATAKLKYDQAGDNEEQKQKALDSIGPLTTIRDSLAYDWVARQKPSTDNGCTTYDDTASVCTVIGYDAVVERVHEPPVLRAVQVQTPAPDGRSDNTRAAHLYQYNLDQKQATVAVNGLADSFRSRTVTYDDGGRMVAATDFTGATITAEWNAKDKGIATVDAAGRRSTTVYDHADRPIDGYGPAPAACFTGQTPTPACAATLPHNHTNYDEGLAGLSAAYYDNPTLSGVPKLWATGVGGDGSLSATWGASPPVPNRGGWSGRFTGEIQLPTTGDYGLGFTVVDGVRLWVDDVLTVDSWGDQASTAVAGKYRNTVAGSWHRVRVDYYNRSGTTGALNFTWTPPGADAPVTVPGANLAPRYGYMTSKVTDSASGGSVERAPSTRTATSYSDLANGIDPVFGLVMSKTNDPGGANQVRRSGFEKPGEGYLRKTAEALPGGDITNPGKRNTTAYYGDTETRSNPCDLGSPAINQGGMAKTITAAKNADGSANTAESVYDAAGRVVATRVNNQPWSCTSYDARGRVVKDAFPAMDGQPARTIVTDYAAGGDPLTKKVSDDSGATTSVVDLLGRVVSYTDATGAVTTTRYDQAGRKTRDSTSVNGVTSTVDYTWNDASQLTGVAVDGAAVATPTYNSAEELTNVAYSNGSSLAITYNRFKSVTALAWKTPGSTVTDTVTRSRDQRATDDTITDTAGGTYNYAYTYDGVGRLVAASVPHHQLTYRYAGDGGCGPNTKAGANSNRTTLSDSLDGAPAVTTAYCYDDADRLLSTRGGLALSLTYDAYGNATKIGGDTLGYDSTRRHVSTTTAAGRTVRYTRDVTDRIVARSVQDKTGSLQVTRYGFTSGSGGPDLVLDDSKTLRQRVLKLPGGVVLTKNYDKAQATNWSYPNVHGDILFTTDGTATRTGAIHLYEPFGQDIDPATGAIGDIPIPATAEGGMDFGWLGQHTVPIEHLASQQALEMGARTYLPVLGRFLQTDPVSGGSANNYDYANADPVNGLDLDGRDARSGGMDINRGLYINPYGDGVAGGEGITPGQVSALLHECFNCYFKIDGAPKDFPTQDQTMMLKIHMPGHDAQVPTRVTGIVDNPGDFSFQLDVSDPSPGMGTGSVRFHFYSLNDSLRLGVEAHINGLLNMNFLNSWFDNFANNQSMWTSIYNDIIYTIRHR